MREFLETIEDQLRRLAAEGNDSVPLDDESVAILRRMASSVSVSSAKAGRSPGVLRSDAEKNFVDDVEEVKFLSNTDLSESIMKPNKEKSARGEKITVKQNFSGVAPIPEPQAFTLPDAGKTERWNALREIVLGDKVCAQHVKPGKKIVFGVGNLNAKIFFCGEAPGADEEIQGEPFVGKAGQLLTKIIAAMGLSRSDVYIGNIMNWRPEVPKGNRPPTEEEMRYCLPYLKAQIEIVNPQIVVALGMTAVNGLLGFDPSRRMGKIRGHWHSFEGRDLMVTYHPSFLLQYASAAIKRLVWEDMMAVMERAGMDISEKQRGYFLKSK